MTRDSPSPIMSMLRSILWSLCSFLLRASRAWEVRSSGAGFTTRPLHSTFQIEQQQYCLIMFSPITLYTSHRHNVTSPGLKWTYIVDRNDAPCSYELKGLLIVSVIVQLICIDEHKVICSSFPGCYQFIWWNRDENTKCKNDCPFLSELMTSDF